MIGRTPESEASALVAGFALWSLSFVLLYGAHGTICSIGASTGVGARAILVGLWAMMLTGHLALITWFVLRLRSAPKEARFVRVVAFTLAVAALGATLWTGLPVVGLHLC